MKLRIKIIRAVMLIIILFLLGRITQIQIIEGKMYRGISENQGEYISNDNDLERGDIYFRKKDSLFLAATEKDLYNLAINPREIEDIDVAYKHLSKFIKIDETSFRNMAALDDPYEVLRRRIGEDLRNQILIDAPRGIIFDSEKRRFYPGEELAAHLIGFIGEGGDGLSGKYGIEQYYNEELSGGDNFFKEEEVNSSIFSRLSKPIFYSAGKKDAILTIDVSVQSFAESIFDGVLKKWNAKNGGLIVIKPQSGKVLAMVSRPGFDPNKYYVTDDYNIFLNSNIQSIYEMGSIFKPITVSSAIDLGVINPNTTYIDKGYRVIDGYKIQNYDGRGRGEVDMQRVLSDSLNTGVVFIVEQMGKENFKKYIERFGLDETTGIDLAGEVGGNTKNLNSNGFIEFATASYGQGIGVTPIGIASALSAVGNGGSLMRPYVVEELIDENGSIKKTKPKKIRDVISEESSKTITRMLVRVVDEVLAGGNGSIPGYSMAAKTGTAQIPNKDSRGYSRDFMHSFFGYAPAYDPEFLILIYVEKPVGARYASETLTEPYKELMQFLLNYYNIPPDRP